MAQAKPLPATPPSAAHTGQTAAEDASAEGAPWMEWWRPWFERWSPPDPSLPRSAAFVQPIAPETHWFSPIFNIAGNRRIEADVVTNVASYGKQLGMLTEALLAMAKKSDDPAVKRLRDLAEIIEERKHKCKADAAEAARRALEDLKTADSDAFKRLLRQYAD